jgi:hypothetical protein
LSWQDRAPLNFAGSLDAETADWTSAMPAMSVRRSVFTLQVVKLLLIHGNGCFMRVELVIATASGYLERLARPIGCMLHALIEQDVVIPYLAYFRLVGRSHPAYENLTKILLLKANIFVEKLD